MRARFEECMKMNENNNLDFQKRLGKEMGWFSGSMGKEDFMSDTAGDEMMDAKEMALALSPEPE